MDNKIYVTVYYDTFTKNAFLWEAFADFETLEQAESFHSQFPKSINLKIGTLSRGREIFFMVHAKVRLVPQGDNIINENGVKRFNRLIKTGLCEYRKTKNPINCYSTLEEAIEAIQKYTTAA